MSDDGPIKAYIGSFPIADTVIIPPDALRRASDEIDRETARRREAAAAAEAAAAIERATKRGWWRKLREMFWRR